MGVDQRDVQAAQGRRRRGWQLKAPSQKAAVYQQRNDNGNQQIVPAWGQGGGGQGAMHSNILEPGRVNRRRPPSCRSGVRQTQIAAIQFQRQLVHAQNVDFDGGAAFELRHAAHPRHEGRIA